MCRERAENTLEPHLCHRGLLLVGEPSNTQRQCLGWWQEVKKPQWKGGDQRWCQSWDRCAQWKSFWGGKRHSHQRQGAEDKVLRRRQPGETMGHWVSVAGATGAREQQTRGYVRWSMGFWGHAREEEGILRYCQRSLDNVSVPHSREAKHSKFYTTDFQARLWSPAHRKLGSIIQQSRTCWLILGSSPLHTTLEHCFLILALVSLGAGLYPLSCVSPSFPSIWTISNLKKKSDHFSP